MHIIGTAGHVDHGKSSLVSALTGTNPDRWLEEQLRGMTLDLGFAHLVLDGNVEAGIVDVPGHERFLHNMLAGAAGMDVLLLVVDVNEGVMPQTVEHLEILKYLNVRRTIVALTKIDLIEPGELHVARDAIVERLQGTIAQDAPVVGVSSTTGAGLDDLRAQILDALRSLPPRDADAPVYLPIDRVFSLAGLGTIVTGTLMQGRIAAGDALAFGPSGIEARVRGLHVFGSSRRSVDAGSRVALNVPTIDRHAIARGEVATSREFSARSNLAVRFTPLESAVGSLRLRNAVHAYVGSAEILGTLVLRQVPAGAEEVRAELLLRKPVVAFPGVRFVVRRPSPRALLGGGYVEGVQSAGASEVSSPVEDAALSVLRERGLSAVEIGEIALQANTREDAAAKALDGLVERGEAIAVTRPAAYVYGDAARDLLKRTLEFLEAIHRSEPWAMGATSIAIARALGLAEPLLVRVLAVFVERGALANRGGYYTSPEFVPSLTEQQRVFFEALVPASDEQPLLPVPYEGASGAVKTSRVSGAGKAFETLLARGALVKIGDQLYRGSQISTVQARVETFLRRNERMTAAEFRDLIGTSRKYAVPLLEWLDARGVTLRSGDYRTLRKKQPV